MAGSDDYRPRRALPPDDDDQVPAPPDDDTDEQPSYPDDTAHEYPSYSFPEQDTYPYQSEQSADPYQSPQSAGEQPRPLYRDDDADEQPYRNHDADEHPKPLYRDEVPGQTDDQPTGRTPVDQTEVGRAPAAPAGTAPTLGRRHPDDDVIDDLGDIDDDGPRLSQRGRLALLIGAVAAIVVLGLAIGYAVIGRPNGPSAEPPGGASPSPGTSESSTTGTPGKTEGELLSTEMLVNPEDAKPIDEKQDWKVTRTVTKVDETAPQAICLEAAIEGLPTPREAMMQILGSGGKSGPAILHQATAYSSAEEAAQAYALIAKAVGNCTVDGVNAWLYSGRTVTGLGDQSLGVVIKVVDGKNDEFRSVVLSRTGSVLNVVDVAKQKKGIPVGDAVQATAAAVNRQCTAVEGKCAKETGDKAGPPPVGDQPGYLSGGDLPAPAKDAGAWFADDPKNLTEPQHSSGCETADLSKVAGGRAVSRTFLVDGDAGEFGLDQYVVTMKSESEAEKLAKKFRDDWEDCQDRKVTPKVDDPTKIKGSGAKGAKITGWVTLVKVPTNDSETRTYRVAIAWVDTKLVFTFLSPTDKLDIDESDWKRVAVRSAERATQVD